MEPDSNLYKVVKDYGNGKILIKDKSGLCIVINKRDFVPVNKHQSKQ